MNIDQPPAFERRRSGSELLRRLIERDDWLKELAASFGGQSPPLAVIIEGGPGLGKTGFLNAACHLAGEAGLHVLRARGSPREIESPFGVVRQLLQSDPGNISPSEDQLCMGEWTSTPSGGKAPLDEVFHQLFVSFSKRAGERPLVVAIDDMHWADHESLMWVHYLTRRLHSGSIWFLGTATPRVAGVALRAVDSIIAEPSTRVLSLRNLTARAVEQLVGQRLRRDPDDDFARICHEVTGGNPFLLFSLLSNLEQDGAYAEISEEALTTLAPPPVARAILGRMEGLSPETHSFLEATAILGDDVDHRIAAELAGVDASVASQMADALSEIHILRDARPLRFIYPLERSTVCGEMGHARRARAHAEAARLVDLHGSTLDQVADHLLQTEPIGDDWTAQKLERSARKYGDRGQWELAVRCFTRALAEPPNPGARPGLLVSLASAEAALGLTAALDHLGEAAELGADPIALAHAALQCVESYSEGSLPPASVATFHHLAAELGNEHLDLRLRLEVAVATRASNPSGVPMITSNFESALVGKRTGWTRPERMALAHLSYIYSLDPARGSAAYVASMAEQAVDPNDLALDDAFFVIVTARALTTMVRAGRFDMAQHLTRLAQAVALKSNSKLAIAEFSVVLAHALNLQGSLDESEIESRRALAAAENHPWQSRPMCVGLLAATLVDQGRTREAVSLLETEPPISTPKTLADLAPLEQRSRIRLLEGRTDEALADLRPARQWAESRGVRNPAVTSWRALVSSAFDVAGRLPEARELAKQNLEEARAFGALWSLGSALRIAGKMSEPSSRLTLLSESSRVLEPAGALVEYARASIDLGVALRMDDQDVNARSALRRGADLAFRCHAKPLANRAERELRAAGARPRRLALIGSEALTPAERRVAELAAAGKNNAGIAHALFISDKTVEGHLSRCYQKLGIRSRAELRQILNPHPQIDGEVSTNANSNANGNGNGHGAVSLMATKKGSIRPIHWDE
jgi:DNA-binding CsgD family transcriptional regulator